MESVKGQRSPEEREEQCFESEYLRHYQEKENRRHFMDALETGDAHTMN